MLTRTALDLAERAWLSDAVVRRGIRWLLRRRLDAIYGRDVAQATAQVIDRMNQSPIALSTREANDQHYDVPAELFEHMLGPHLKYSSALWETETTSLAAAEEAMLALTCARADIRDGQKVLDLGCGWGSLSLWVAVRYPASTVLAVSNSSSQREFIERRAAARGIRNLRVVTADMNDFAAPERVDRIVSVEMFEHMRNQGQLLRRMAEWLLPGGQAFVHVFCHREVPYFFEVEGETDWMAKHFFTGGVMPSATLLAHFDDALRVSASWTVNGLHYTRTLLAWLDRLDAARPQLQELFLQTYGRDATVWIQRWRLFLLACAELFAFRNGEEWFVTHYSLTPVAGR